MNPHTLSDRESALSVSKLLLLGAGESGIAHALAVVAEAIQPARGDERAWIYAFNLDVHHLRAGYHARDSHAPLRDAKQ